MTRKLSEQVVVVTGASSGIGRATAILLARKGASVWAAARNEVRLKELASEHDGITPFRCDVAVDDDRAALIDAAGPVGVLVNNAGLGYMGLVEDMDPQDVRNLFEINVLGLIDLTQRVLPGMLERRHGHITNVASVASFVSTPPLTMYSATKFAVQGFTEGLRREMNGRGVTVAMVNPGPIATEFGARSLAGPVGTASTGPNRGQGLGVGLVAHAILRTIRYGFLPGYDAISVPRLMGFTRLAQVPVIDRLIDLSALAGRPAFKQLRHDR
jgi:short-subunit dehydrogenase